MSKILLVNPARRKKRRKKTTRKRPTRRRARRRNPAPARRRRRRSNPRMTGAKVQRQLTTATTGAVGALALDIALAYIPLPANLQTGIVGKAVKGLGAIALGVVANRLGVKAENANRMAEGALTVQIHGIGKELLTQFAPGIAMSAYVGDEALGYYGSGWNPNVPDDPDYMGTYLPDISADDVGIDEQGFAMYEGHGAGFDTW